VIDPTSGLLRMVSTHPLNPQGHGFTPILKTMVAKKMEWHRVLCMISRCAIAQGRVAIPGRDQRHPLPKYLAKARIRLQSLAAAVKREKVPGGNYGEEGSPDEMQSSVLYASQLTAPVASSPSGNEKPVTRTLAPGSRPDSIDGLSGLDGNNAESVPVSPQTSLLGVQGR
jgi:hypothetical protein